MNKHQRKEKQRVGLGGRGKGKEKEKTRLDDIRIMRGQRSTASARTRSALANSGMASPKDSLGINRQLGKMNTFIQQIFLNT